MKFKIISLLIISMILIGVFYILTSPYRMDRVKNWFNNTEVVEYNNLR